VLLDQPAPFDHGIALAPAGDLLLASTVSTPGVDDFVGPPEFALIDVLSGDRIVEADGQVAGAAFSPDGARMVVHALVDEAPAVPRALIPQLLVYDTASGDLLTRVPTASFARFDAVEFSADGRLLAVGEPVENEVVVYDFDTLLDDPEAAVVARASLPTVAGASAVEISQDGSMVVVSLLGPDGEIVAFDIENGGNVLWEFETGQRVFDVDLHDDLYWYPQLTASGVALNAMPIDREAYTEFARSRATRELDADECALYLGAPCPPPIGPATAD